MTLWDVRRLFAYWRGAPPTHELVAAFMGVKPPEASAPQVANGDDPSGIGAMMMRAPGGLVRAD